MNGPKRTKIQYLKERIDLVMQAQMAATEKGKVLLSTFEQLWLPVLNDLPDIEYVGQECHHAPYGTIRACAQSALSWRIMVHAQSRY